MPSPHPIIQMNPHMRESIRSKWEIHAASGLQAEGIKTPWGWLVIQKESEMCARTTFYYPFWSHGAKPPPEIQESAKLGEFPSREACWQAILSWAGRNGCPKELIAPHRPKKAAKTPRKPRWKHPAPLRAVLAEYVLWASGCTRTEKEIQGVMTEKGVAEIRYFIVGRFSPHNQRTRRLFDALAALEERN